MNNFLLFLNKNITPPSLHLFFSCIFFFFLNFSPVDTMVITFVLDNGYTGVLNKVNVRSALM